MSKIPGTTRHPTHRLGVIAAALAVTTAGLVSAVPAQAAPAPAPAAAPAPDNYTPRPGALFNKPIGTRAEQYRLFTHINRAINSARAGSVIRIAVFSFSDGRTADNLIKAHRRGVHVKLGVTVGRGVHVEVAVLVGRGVKVKVIVGVAVLVGVLDGVNVNVGVREGVKVGVNV